MKINGLSIILPVYNEKGNIEKVIEEITNFLFTQCLFKDYEIIAVDDGSKDGSGLILKNFSDKIPYIKIVTHCKNLGYGDALVSGFKVSRYPLIFFMDADGQFNIREIEKMISCIADFDIVMGYRHERADTFYRAVLGKCYSWLVFILFGLKFQDVNCGFKLFKRETLDLKNRNGSAGAFYTGILLKAKNKGFKIKEIAVGHFPRLKGKQTGANPRVVFNSVIDLIKLKYYQYSHKIHNASQC